MMTLFLCLLTYMCRPSSEAERHLMAKGLATVYDPTEPEEPGRRSGSDPTASSSNSSGKPRVSKGAPVVRPDISNLPGFLVTPGVRGGQIQCYIDREKGLKGYT
jgi:hypothetical protein